ncbi:hypothetical protein B0H14DRAFT_2566029 [Mycena olivaceomarginata]|nr:hypothetical protein B0H14DRAFT_2566029 [Mycena olivaceomarginata]
MLLVLQTTLCLSFTIVLILISVQQTPHSAIVVMIQIQNSSVFWDIPELKHGYQHSRISNTTLAISMESNSTHLSSFCNTGCYIKCCVHYHKLCKTHVYGIGVQVDQGEQTACKNHTFTSVPSTASSLYPGLHPITDIDFNQQHTIYTSYTLNAIQLVLLYLPCIEVRFSKK